MPSMIKIDKVKDARHGKNVRQFLIITHIQMSRWHN